MYLGLYYNVIDNFNAYAEIMRSAEICIGGGAEYRPKRAKKKYYHNSKK